MGWGGGGGGVLCCMDMCVKPNKQGKRWGKRSLHLICLALLIVMNKVIVICCFMYHFQLINMFDPWAFKPTLGLFFLCHPTGLFTLRGWNQRQQSSAGSHLADHRHTGADVLFWGGEPRTIKDPVRTGSVQTAEETWPVPRRGSVLPSLLVRQNGTGWGRGQKHFSFSFHIFLYLSEKGELELAIVS